MIVKNVCFSLIVSILGAFILQVVDARAGPGTKSTLKMKNKLSPTMQKYKSPLKAKNRSSTQLQQAFASIPSPLPEELSGKNDNSKTPKKHFNCFC